MVTESASSSPKLSQDPRGRKLLEAALTVFTRFGFRKTSMDQIARAANVSRQGLYLHFSTKEELFRATVQHALEAAFHAANEQLDNRSLPTPRRLIGAFDEWVGRYVGMVGGGGSGLGEASNTLVGPLLAEHEKRFLELVAKYIRSSGLATAYKPAGVTARQLAETLYATARGLKHDSATRADFVHGIRVAVRAMCLPLPDAK